MGFVFLLKEGGGNFCLYEAVCRLVFYMAKSFQCLGSKLRSQTRSKSGLFPPIFSYHNHEIA